MSRIGRDRKAMAARAALELEDGTVRRFREKPAGDGATINGGFFVLDPA